MFCRILLKTFSPERYLSCTRGWKWLNLGLQPHLPGGIYVYITTQKICTRFWSFSGPWFNIKMSSCQYRKSHCGDKTVVRSSYLHNKISYAGKMSPLYWIGALVVVMSTSSKFALLKLGQSHGTKKKAHLYTLLLMIEYMISLYKNYALGKFQLALFVPVVGLLMIIYTYLFSINQDLVKYYGGLLQGWCLYGCYDCSEYCFSPFHGGGAVTLAMLFTNTMPTKWSIDTASTGDHLTLYQ